MKSKGSSEDRKRKKKMLLREQVYAGIKNAIISGEFEPGRRLIEERLAEDMKTSRTPVREAIQKLEKEGLIHRLPRGGFAVKGVSEEEVEEVFGLRAVLEGYAAYLATARITGGRAEGPRRDHQDGGGGPRSYGRGGIHQTGWRVP